MGVIKQIAVHNGITWQKKDIGVNAENVSYENGNIIDYIGGQINNVNGNINNINDQIGSEEQANTILKRIKDLEDKTPGKIDDRLEDLETKVGERDDDATGNSLFAKITSINNQISNKVSKSGDTMTGDLIFKQNEQDFPNTQKLVFKNYSDRIIGSFQEENDEYQGFDGTPYHSSYLTINNKNFTDNVESYVGNLENLEFNNYLKLGITAPKEGNFGQHIPTVQFGYPLAWKSGLLSSSSVVESWKTSLGVFTPQYAVPVSYKTISVPNATNANFGNFTFTPGLWLISIYAAFTKNTTGRRAFFMSETSTGSSSAQINFNTNAVEGANTTMTFARVMRYTENALRYFNAYQNSGGALNVTATVICLKLAEEYTSL